MAVMIQDEKEYTTKELVSQTNLELFQVQEAIRFLQKGKIINPSRYTKIKTKPYRKAHYSLNPEKYEAIIKLIERDYK